MTTRPALSLLSDFIEDPTLHNASRLVDIPSLLELLQHEYQVYENYSKVVISTCKWIFKRGTMVLEQLKVHGSLPIQTNARDIEWHKVRSHTCMTSEIDKLALDRLLLWKAPNLASPKVPSPEERPSGQWRQSWIKMFQVLFAVW